MKPVRLLTPLGVAKGCQTGRRPVRSATRPPREQASSRLDASEQLRPFGEEFIGGDRTIAREDG